MGIIRFTPFGGLIPKSDPSMLPAPAAQIANNCRFSSGQLEAFNLPEEVRNPVGDELVSLGVANTVQTIYRFGQATDSDLQYWFASDADTNFVKTAVANDTEERTMFTGTNLTKPQVTTASRVGSSGLPLQLGSYDLGIPSPIIAPVISATGSYAPSAVAETRAYIYTFVNALGEESPPSEASNSLSVYPASTLVVPAVPEIVAVTAVAPQAAVPAVAEHWNEDHTELIPATPYVPAVREVKGVVGVAGTPEIRTEYPAQTVTVQMGAVPTGAYSPATSRRIYRTSTGVTGADYLFVAEIDEATLVYEDTVLTSLLGEPCPTIGMSTIPDNARGLTSMPNGIMACFSGYDVYFCPPFKPYVWPDDYRQTVDYPIVGLGAFGQSLAVLTTGVPYIITGTDPQSMSMEKLTVAYACLSKRSIVQAMGGVLYAAADGLVAIDYNGPKVITEALFTRREWQLLNPSSMMCCVWDERIFMFYDTGSVQGGLILDATNGLTTTDVYATAAFTDPVTGDLFLVVNGVLVKWDAGAVGTFRWKSRRDVQMMPKNFAYGQVVATQYPITMKVYAEDVLSHTQTVTDANPFRLPSGFRARYWEVELLGAGRVLSAVLADSAVEIQNV